MCDKQIRKTFTSIAFKVLNSLSIQEINYCFLLQKVLTFQSVLNFIRAILITVKNFKIPSFQYSSLIYNILIFTSVHRY